MLRLLYICNAVDFMLLHAPSLFDTLASWGHRTQARKDPSLCELVVLREFVCALRAQVKTHGASMSPITYIPSAATGRYYNENTSDLSR